MEIEIMGTGNIMAFVGLCELGRLVLDLDSAPRDLRRLLRDLGSAPRDLGRLLRDLGSAPRDLGRLLRDLDSAPRDLGRLVLDPDCARPTLNLNFIIQSQTQSYNGDIRARPSDFILTEVT